MLLLRAVISPWLGRCYVKHQKIFWGNTDLKCDYKPRSLIFFLVFAEEAQGNGYKYRKCDGTVVKTFGTGFNSSTFKVICNMLTGL